MFGGWPHKGEGHDPQRIPGGEAGGHRQGGQGVQRPGRGAGRGVSHGCAAALLPSVTGFKRERRYCLGKTLGSTFFQIRQELAYEMVVDRKKGNRYNKNRKDPVNLTAGPAR